MPDHHTHPKETHMDIDDGQACPACDAPPLEWCVGCGRCACDRHDHCTRPTPAPSSRR
jgi:hypothetical protein